MKINLCPNCGKEPSMRSVFVAYAFLGFIIECYDCELRTDRYYDYDEAVAEWNEMTKGVK